MRFATWQAILSLVLLSALACADAPTAPPDEKIDDRKIRWGGTGKPPHPKR